MTPHKNGPDRAWKIGRALSPALMIILFFVLPETTEALRLDIRLFSKHNIHSVKLTVVRGEYKIESGTSTHTLQRFQIVRLKAEEGKVMVTQHDRVVFTGSHIRFRGQQQENIFRLNAHKHRERNYDDDLIIKAYGNSLILINNVDLENYVAGVVESESGKDGNPEFYKVQDIISRTYALRNLRRHKHEGYNLCDEEHCQVYHSRSYYEMIHDAAIETAGCVIVDSSGELITAAFHANSGGETVNSEDVWTYPLPYLRAQLDTFGEQMSRARWEKRIPRQEWLSYLKRKYNIQLTDSNIYKVTHFSQPVRQTMMLGRIPLEEVRTDWRLRSTFFCIEPDGDEVLLKGRGWGHGVGLNQQGAIRMTELGSSHEEVIKFYYPGVRIINMNELAFPPKP